jgi:hypothetical protein
MLAALLCSRLPHTHRTHGILLKQLLTVLFFARLSFPTSSRLLPRWASAVFNRIAATFCLQRGTYAVTVRRQASRNAGNAHWWAAAAAAARHAGERAGMAIKQTLPAGRVGPSGDMVSIRYGRGMLWYLELVALAWVAGGVARVLAT